ncbi:MAG TPA: DNA-directed RNA polymerase subunit beta, partial [Candidatus Dormibacteraeota bacterium]|nr:DNA-directed RNA polymerase subunit beta [Candidatus Dormibacteraeota bacterium]
MITAEMKAAPRHNYGRIRNLVELKDLIATQLDSFTWFKAEGLRELFDEINPITDYTGKNFELRFLDYEFGPPKFTEEECRNRDMTYSAPLRIKTRLTIKETGEIKESEVYMGDFAIMTSEGTFIVNGTERVVVSQLVRSPGVYFTSADDPVSGRRLFGAKLIPNRGAWLEIETSTKDVMTVKVDRKRKVPVTVLLKALELSQLKGKDVDREVQRKAIFELFQDVDNNADHHYIDSTIDKDLTLRSEEALIELYKRIRPGDPATVDNARNLLQSLFFNARRFDMGRVGRYKLDRRLGRPEEEIHERVRDRSLRIMEKGDFVHIIRKLIELNNSHGGIADDIDHLGNRRVRAVGELLQNQFRMGLIRMERIIKERMTICDPQTVTAASLINARPVVAAIKEFFGSSQLSQFMDQTNPLAELTHKRRLSALGPGGLSRERAGFDVRDVHYSHYGRICPIETPEGPNIGLIGYLATYAKVNEYGFVETPFRRVYNRMSISKDNSERLDDRVLRRPALAGEKEILPASTRLTSEAITQLEKAGVQSVDIVPWVSEEVVYLSADEEDLFGIAQANAGLAADGTFAENRVPCRTRGHFALEEVQNIQYMDVSPKQIVSVATALIPFLEHDDANRALMGSNMQRQAVPLLKPDSPYVGTGVEYYAARDSGEMIVAEVDGVILDVANPKEIKGLNANPVYEVILKPDDGSPDRHYPLQKFYRSNQGTCLNHRVTVKPGDKVAAGDILADGPSIEDGEIALGQ